MLEQSPLEEIFKEIKLNPNQETNGYTHTQKYHVKVGLRRKSSWPEDILTWSCSRWWQ